MRHLDQRQLLLLEKQRQPALQVHHLHAHHDRDPHAVGRLGGDPTGAETEVCRRLRRERRERGGEESSTDRGQAHPDHTSASSAGSDGDDVSRRGLEFTQCPGRKAMDEASRPARPGSGGGHPAAAATAAVVDDDICTVRAGGGTRVGAGADADRGSSGPDHHPDRPTPRTWLVLDLMEIPFPAGIRIWDISRFRP